MLYTGKTDEELHEYLYNGADQYALVDFAKYDRDNPRIYWAFCNRVNEALTAGRTKYSASAIISRMRWDHEIETRSDSEFKLSASHTSLYVRKYIWEHKHMVHFFELRPLVGFRAEYRKRRELERMRARQKKQDQGPKELDS